ncbi:MAG: type I glutamate--ammonia ligase [Thermotoga sp.]|nr:MAG: type I glutamate--ammonia ligase [Thermotoga sp.]
MDEERILKIVRDENIKFIRLQLTDINGVLKNVEIPSDQLEEAFEKGIMFDGSSIDGFVRIDESDMYLRPDPKTFAILPWSREDSKSARMICDVYLPNGEPFQGDPRYRLKKVVEKAKEMGFTAYAGPEPEFFLLKRDEFGKPILDFMDSGGYFDMMPLDFGEAARKDMVLALEKMGIEVEASHHEVAPSQHEIDFRYTDILTTADNVQTFKFVVKTIALFHKLHATFMPKPFFGVNGSGMHTHMSLFRNDENAFVDPDKPYGLSDTAMNFIGGILKHARTITAVTNPTVNSYKRLVPGYEAPVNVAWSVGNRSALIRVPADRGKATRIEYRSPDPSCNAYLAFAVMLGAGLDGIEKDIKPPKPVEENIFAMDETKKMELEIETLPSDLKEALQLMEKDPLVREVLGDHIYNKFLEMKYKEWKDYSTRVTNWEIDRYLNVF